VRFGRLGSMVARHGAAARMVIGGVTFPLGDGPEWVGVPVTMLWFVGVSNAFNLIDNHGQNARGVAWT
jgi:UDP-N-acetylmuramyl pentapeptide phosphotransferase/UDP-N-acetylglucosamine-1-phosphate transferase